MTLTRATPGKPLRIPAGAYNAFCDAAEEFQRNGYRTGLRDSTPGGGNRSALIVEVINETGHQLDAAHPCWLDELESSAPLDQSRYDASGRPMLRAVFRWGVSTARMTQLFGVCLEAIPAGSIGRVVIDGVCAAYIAEANGSAYVQGVAAGRHAVPIQAYTGFQADRCALGRSATEGPVEILHEIDDEDDIDPELTEDRIYLVRIRQTPYCIRSFLNVPIVRDYFGTNSGMTATETLGLSRTSNIDADVGNTNGDRDGFYQVFSTITAPSTSLTSLDNDGVIESSILRVPCKGMYDVRFTAMARLQMNILLGISSLQVGDSLGISQLIYCVKLVTLNSSGDEVAEPYGAWPSTYTSPNLNVGLDLVNHPILIRGGSANSITGPAESRGSVAGFCRIHLYDHLRVALRIVCRDPSSVSGATLPDITLTVSGTLEIKAATPELYLSPGHTVIVGTPGTTGEHDYTLASTGTLAPPSVTISTYAWRVWAPDGTDTTATGSSYAHDYESSGDGEYVARLIVTYSDGAKGAEEFRFTLPNP